MNYTPIEIHEFSTGIKPDIDASGNWVSRGFTGRYMNCTLPEIPYNVERAIANQLFAVIKGYTTEQPAIIGRVVPGNSDSRNELGKWDWSVVAIVSLGRDEKGRPLTVYRYFLSQGLTLHRIVDWIEQSQQSSEGRVPVFDPTIQRNTGDCYRRPSLIPPAVILREGLRRRLNSEPNPILYTGQHKNFRDQLEQLSLKEIHYSAAYKATNEDRAISWAYNVEALEFPESFILIHTANKDASRRINDALNDSDSSIPRMLPAATVDIQMLRASIKSLMSGSVKQNTVRTIVEALEDDLVTEDIWQRIFDGEGATRGIQQNIYSPPMLRLLTLRAVAIPRTLPDFLNWFKNHHDLINKKEFLNFQSKFRDCTSRFFELEDNLFQGIIQAFESLKKATKVPPELLSYFLGQQKSFWNVCFYRLLEGVNRDLEKICHQQTDIKYSQILWQDIINYKNSYSYKKQKKSILPEYKPFAILFEHLAKYDRKYLKLSAYFYQISQSLVADKLFREAFGNSRLEEDYLGINIQKQLTSKEKILSQLSTISKAAIDTLNKAANLVLKVVWFIINNLILNIIKFPLNLLWSNGKRLAEACGKLIEEGQGFNILISIYFLIFLLLGSLVLKERIPEFHNRISIETPQEKLNESIKYINKYLEKKWHKSLNDKEKRLFVLNELLLTDRLKEDCIVDKSSSVFPEYKNIGDQCRKNLIRGFKDYERETKDITEGSIEVDGIIEAENIKFIETQISGLFDSQSERYQQLVLPIIKNTVNQVDDRIEEIKNDNEQLDVDYWFKVALKDSLVPKNENLFIPDEYLNRTGKTEQDVKNNPEKHIKDMIKDWSYSSLENIEKQIINKDQKLDKLMQTVWLERIFAACLKSEECNISSTKEQEAIASIENFIESKLLSEAKEITNTYLEAIRNKNTLETRFISNEKSLEQAFNSFKVSYKSIHDIEKNIYDELVSNLYSNKKPNVEQEKIIKQEIQQIIKKTLSIVNYELLADLSEIDINKTKEIDLNELKTTLNIDNIETFKNQLEWIKAIYDYQDYPSQDGIVSGSQKGTGGNLKNIIIDNEIESLKQKALSVTNSPQK